MLNGTMKTSFRDAFNFHFESTNAKVVDVANGSGVTRSKINKLRRAENNTVEVEDATALALYFGMTVPVFMRMGKEASPTSLDELAELLSDEDRRKFEVEIIAAAARHLKGRK